MQRRPPSEVVTSLPATVPLSMRGRLWLAATGAFRAETRQRFRNVLHQSGWRGTLRHLARYVGLRR
jgi:hypothetical protein